MSDDNATLIGCEAIGKAYFGGDRKAAQHACATGQIPAFKLLGQWRLRPTAFQAHIERLEAENVARRGK